uniref:hypothetical protein n=1 Tax=Ahnfeltia fastigiata TaxID=31363 RepID=UPI001D10E548|nr:hypothetical protein LK038_pgp050 [Ahnfeltia fastigiata]UAT97624.1 hypothetical protein Ahn.fas.Ore.pt_191 [Ahnfeltia fastigiata]UAT97828.1 hypothetical protein Ahn.fas.Kor.pt_192 [Ahnfeltia fastigiata]
MFISKDVCPVPFDQQPLNEYYSLKDSWFFSWSTLSIGKYSRKLFLISAGLVLLLSPVITPKTPIVRFLITDLLLVTFFLSFILIRLYLGWSYVVKRLLSATVFYEESGWYDGQLWIKTAEILTKDRLIGIYEVLPLLQRIQYTLSLVISLIILESLMYYLLS